MRSPLLDGSGNLYIVESIEYRVRRVSAGEDGILDGDADEIISTIAGTGARDYAGDGAQATAAQLQSPLDVAVFGGETYISEHDDHVIRVISG